MPGSGGSYRYLREGFGRERWGRLGGFLFIWQFILSGPLEIASGYIGFCALSPLRVAGPHADRHRRGRDDGGRANIALLYRRIGQIGRADRQPVDRHAAHHAGGDRHRRAATSIRRWRSTSRLARSISRSASCSASAPRRASASTTISATTTSATSATRCKDPGRVIPRSILISVLAVAVIYIGINLSIIGVVPWREFVPGRRPSAVGLHRLGIHGADLRTAGGDAVHGLRAVDGVRVRLRAAARLLAHPLRGGARRLVLQGLRPAPSRPSSSRPCRCS